MNNESTKGYKEFIDVLKRGKSTILLITILATLAAVLFSYHSMKSTKPMYQTETSVVIGSKADIVNAVTSNPTFEQIANSSTIAKNVSLALKGSIPVSEIQKSYEIKVSADAPILTITASGESQKQSKDIAKVVITSLTKEVQRIYPKQSMKIMENSVQSDLTQNKFKSMNVILTFLLGLFLSIFIVTFRGFFDEKIWTKEDAEKYTGISVIGNNPKRKQKKYPTLDSMGLKTFNQLKSNIQLLNADSEKKVIMIASGENNEGRSTTATYLSLSLAKGGKKTLIVDCDLKNPNIHTMFDLINGKGLLDCLAGDVAAGKAIKATKQENLSVLTSGTLTLDYAELFVSRFSEFITTLKKDYDYIILDTSPITTGVDVEVLSKYVDSCVLVVKAGGTERKDVIKAKEILQKVDGNIIGVFLNEMD